MLKASQVANVSSKAEIRDGGDIVLNCKNCESPLLILWVTRPEAKYDWVVKANCPYCGEGTEQYNVHGMFHQAPFHIVTDEETMENEADLYIETFVENDGVIEFLLKRHKK